MAAPARLRLRANDAEDIQVLSAVLQDALVPLADMAYQTRERRFVMVANRFCWEQNGVERGVPQAEASSPDGEAGNGNDARFDEPDGALLFERVNCGVRFDKVTRVRARNMDLKAKDQILNLLSIQAEPKAVTLVFSGGGEVRLDVATIACHLEDIGEPWPTRWRPAHDPGDTPAT